MSGYAELQVTSNFSFLRGGSHPEELINEAVRLELKGIALTDHNSLAGIVRAHLAAKNAAKESKLQYIVGCRLDLAYQRSLNRDSTAKIAVLVYPTGRESYGALCRLLSLGKLRAPKGECHLEVGDFLKESRDLVCVLVPPGADAGNTEELEFLNMAKFIKENLPDPRLLSLAISRSYSYLDRRRLTSICQAAEHLQIPLVVTNDVYYHATQRRPLQDVLTCIREKTSIDKAGFLLFQNSERCLKGAQEMARLFKDLPAAIARTIEICEMTAKFSLDLLRYEYPDEICPDSKTPIEYLSELACQGARQRYPQGVPAKVAKLLQDELALIEELHYEKYFLTCFDIVKFAAGRGILCQGRGAAANSAVCFCLGITAVDPDKIDILFARFVSKERSEPPDIDIDFEHERREEVIQYIYQKYGRDRAGLVCEVVTYRQRSAAREVGKALGLSLKTADSLAKSIHRWTSYGVSPDDLRELGVDPHSTAIRNTLILAKELIGFPRHLSQHVGGFIITQRALSESVPILNASMPDRTIIEWDKDDIEALGMLKIDILGLGMLSCIRKALGLINARRAQPPLELYTLPPEDPAVYDMICAADTIGVFQIESRAQMSMLPRLRPRCFYDLVIEVAIVRPGPIQGNMVHPFLKRRQGLEKPYYPDRRVEEILGKTLGVPLFQEQAMRLAIVLAGFPPGEAEQLRRAMAAWKRDKGLIAKFKERIVGGMLRNGYSLKFAESCMDQLKGFSEYGFPESHAASFALLVYASAWIKKHHSAEFAAALLNSQPMGFYAPSQIIRDAQNHGVEILPIGVNCSVWDILVIEGAKLRLGMRLIKGLSQGQAEIIVQAVKEHGHFASIIELWSYCHVTLQRNLSRQTLALLARADAFQSIGLSQRQALWEIKALPPYPKELDRFDDPQGYLQVSLPQMSRQQSMFQDYRATGFSLKGHPIGFIRSYLAGRKVSTASELKGRRGGLAVSVAGIAIVRQRPGTAKGMVFLTLEDESGIVNLIIRPNIFERYSKVIMSSSCVLARGVLEKASDVIYVNTAHIESLDREVLELEKVGLPGRSYSY